MCVDGLWAQLWNVIITTQHSAHKFGAVRTPPKHAVRFCLHPHREERWTIAHTHTHDEDAMSDSGSSSDDRSRSSSSSSSASVSSSSSSASVSSSDASSDDESVSSDGGVVHRRTHKINKMLSVDDLSAEVRCAAEQSDDPVALERALHREACERGETMYCDPHTGLCVFTKVFLQKKSCCGNGCRHCPYAHRGVPDEHKAAAARVLIVDDW